MRYGVLMSTVQIVHVYQNFVCVFETFYGQVESC
jgi:hypothetical protein